MMDIDQFLEGLHDALWISDGCWMNILGEEIKVKNLETFEEGGWLTMDQGFVMKMEDGSTFHITVQEG